MSNLNFDPYQFARGGMLAVHAEYDGHGFQSGGIGFEDYSRMNTFTHKLNSGRHGATPDWVFNDTKLRAVIVGCIESRSKSGQERSVDTTGTDAQRLARAQARIAGKHAMLEARIDRLCKQYMDAKRAGDDALTKHFAQKVEELDTQIRMTDNPAKFYAGVAYHYWRSGLNSVETGQQLYIKPPHVRQILWRMGKIAGQLGYGAPKRIRHRAGRPPSLGQRAVATTEELLTVAKAVKRQKISATLTGRKRPPMSQAHKDKLSAASRGRVHNETTKQKISAARQGHNVADTTRQKISKARLSSSRGEQATHLIPITQRLPLVVKMYGEGKNTGAIASALGWGHGQGYGMVKRLAIQAGLRAA
jgi:DNA-binding NarL/FixJ family response regulator